MKTKPTPKIAVQRDMSPDYESVLNSGNQCFIHVEHFFPKGYEPDSEPYKSIVKACNAYPELQRERDQYKAHAEALAEAVSDMMHDIDIFYGKYRDPNNKYIAKLKQALADWKAREQ